MASQMARRSIAAFMVLLLVAVGLVVALPFFASTQIVRDRIAQEFGYWSGYRVRLGGVPKIEVWPSIRAELPNVEMFGWGAGDDPPVLISEKIEIDLSAISALAGDIVPTRVRFVRPILRVSRADGELPVLQSPAGGQIRRAIETARVAIDDNPTDPVITDLPSGPVGTVEFVDASIVEVTADDVAETVLLSAMEGVLQWPGFDRAMTLTASGQMNEESVSFSAQISEPLLLFAGGLANLVLTLEADPLQLSFDGTADISDPLFIDGDIQLATPSLRRMVEWTGTDIQPTITVGNTAINGRLKGQVGSIKLEDAEITLAQSRGMGVLEIALDGPRPAASGTLAFDDLDLVSFLSALVILPVPQGGPVGDISSPAIGRFDLDLRLSANSASAGPVGLNEVAAAVQIKDSLATFDISDASGFGGNISTGFRIDRDAGRETGEFRLLAADIDSGALAAAIGAERLVPSARGKISIILNGPVAMPQAFLRAASGSISATFDTGTIAGFDLAGFTERSKAGGFFALDEVADGTLAFERAELKATMANGVASIENAEARTEDQLLTLAGIVPYVGRSLALSGKITSTEESAEPATNLTFFVGGSWGAPFISAILPPPITE